VIVSHDDESQLFRKNLYFGVALQYNLKNPCNFSIKWQFSWTGCWL